MTRSLKKRNKKDILRMIFWKSKTWTFMVLFGLIFSIGCQSSQHELIHVDQLEQGEAICLFFFVPDCPLSENYSVPFRNLKNRYQDSSVYFYAVVPNSQYSKKEIDAFCQEYDLSIEVIVDKEGILSKVYQPQVTPEFILLNKQGVLYQGAFDDWVIELGKYRKRPTQFYLEDAVKAHIHQTPIEIEKTTPIGCFIESD